MKIICSIYGGLGNQMFQYAHGKALAERNGGELFLDLSWFEELETSDTKRYFALDAFKLKHRVASKEDIAILKGEGKRKNRIRSLFKASRSDSDFRKERHYHFDKSMLHINKDAYYSGYWQSDRYFNDFEAVIRSDFTFKDELIGQYKKLRNTMANENSVAIHVRRGDYVTDKRTKRLHGTCSLRYYSKAASLIRTKTSDPVFYFFSDDIDWVKANLKLDGPCVYVECRSAKDYEDLHLMSHCKNYIIANSSFGWWGAWLSTNSDKTVIAPVKWFNKRNKNTRDLIPEGWIRF